MLICRERADLQTRGLLTCIERMEGKLKNRLHASVTSRTSILGKVFHLDIALRVQTGNGEPISHQPLVSHTIPAILPLLYSAAISYINYRRARQTTISHGTYHVHKVSKVSFVKPFKSNHSGKFLTRTLTLDRCAMMSPPFMSYHGGFFFPPRCTKYCHEF